MYTEIKLPNPGVLIKTLPEDIFSEIKSDLENEIPQQGVLRKLKQYNKNLAGQIETEYRYSPKKNFIDFLNDYCLEYCEHFNFTKCKANPLDIWYNVQKKHEYNPHHSHHGELSWVLWVNIPYELQAEDELSNTKNSLLHYNSRFSFVYTTLGGTISQVALDIDKSYEGKMIIFPSNLWHGVFPFFTSDEYRISLAGNFYVDR